MFESDRRPINRNRTWKTTVVKCRWRDNAGIPMLALHFLTTLVSVWKVIHTWGGRAPQEGSIQK
jgi:hypothetical protein